MNVAIARHRICPFMTRPLPHGEYTTLYSVTCETVRCMAWIKTSETTGWCARMSATPDYEDMISKMVGLE